MLSLFVNIHDSDLDFERFAFLIQNSRMQAAIKIILRRGDVIVKFAGDGMPDAVDNAEYLIAGRVIWHDDAHRTHIVNFLKWYALALHLAVDAVDVLGTG